MIEQKFIMNVERYLIGVREDQPFFAGIEITEGNVHLLKKIGFKDITPNQQLLPRPVGVKTSFNAHGGVVRHKDRPKEVHYRSIFVKDWHGSYHLADVPYKRYPRTQIPAPLIELCLVDNNGTLLLISPELENSHEAAERNKTVINIFLEIFGYCNIFTTDFLPVLQELPIKRVNWEISLQENIHGNDYLI